MVYALGMIRFLVPASFLLVLSLSRCTTEPYAATSCIPSEDGSCGIQPQ